MTTVQNDQKLVNQLVKLYHADSEEAYQSLDYQFGDLVAPLRDHFAQALSDDDLESHRLVDEWNKLDDVFEADSILIYRLAQLYRHLNHVGLSEGNVADEVELLHDLVNDIVSTTKVCWPLHVYINYLGQVNDDSAQVWADCLSALTYLGAVAED